MFEDYKDYYEVSNYGRVKSLERTIWHPRPDLSSGGFYRNIHERILSHYVSNNKSGYPSVILCNETKRLNIAIHTLVYTSFIGEVPDGMTINHKDGNKENPYVDNLELATYSENIQHAYDVLDRNRNETYYNYYIKDIETNDVVEFKAATEAGDYFGASAVTITQYAIGHFKGLFKNKYEVSRAEIIK